MKVLNNKGFSIIEVLIGAVVFMLGFTTLMLMLNNVFIKFSTKEYVTAYILADNFMQETIIHEDYRFLDTTIERSNITFRVIRTFSNEDKLNKHRIIVKRIKTNKELLVLYNETNIK